MAVLPDNSSFGNNLVINGSAETRTETPSWRFTQKVVPQGNNARQPGDAFGTIFDQNSTTMVVGTPTHSYDQDGLNVLSSAGSIWAYSRALSTGVRPVLANAAVRRVFNYTGGPVNFVVPTGVRRIRAKLWGAGGGGTVAWQRGGNGGYAEGEIEVEPGETLTIMVGQGGAATHAAYFIPYPNGGYRTTVPNSGYNGSGGGRSAIRRAGMLGDNELLTAGAGGGGGMHTAGAHGGGLRGTDAAASNGYSGGGGATQAGGGVTQNNFGSGSKFAGGYTQGWNGYYYNGGGGDGYYGGSGGVDGYQYGTGGGGGNGYTGGCISGKLGSSSDTMIYGFWDADYVEGIAAGGGIGGGSTNQAGHGMIVLSYVDDSVTADDASMWSQQARLVPKGMNARNAGDQFGYAVAVSNSWIAASAPLHGWDADGTNETSAAGAVFMFQLVNGSWVQQQKVLAQGVNARSAADQFGYSVAMENDVLVVGSPFHEFNEIGGGRVNDAGAVFIYKLVSGVWTLFQKIVSNDVSGRNELDNFGAQVRINNGRIIVQAPGQPYNLVGAAALDHSGAVYVYDLNAQGKWAYTTKLVAANRIAGGLYGSTMDIKGSTIAIGSAVGGVTEIYSLVGTTWTRTDTRAELAASTTQVLLHLNNATGGIIDTTQPLATQPTITGTPVYSADRARFGTGSLALTSSPVTVNLGTRGVLNATGDWTMEFYMNMQDSAYDTGTYLQNAPGPMNQFSYTLIRSTSFSIFLYRTVAETNAGTLAVNVPGGSITLGQMDFDTWQHIALVRRGGNIFAYRNGSLMSQIYVGTGSVALGGDVTFGDANFRGFFNEFRICSEAKYLADFTPPNHPFRHTEGTLLGRGTNVTLLDNNTALVGLPRASGTDTSNKFTHNESNANLMQDMQARHFEGGLVETLSRSGSRWTSSIGLAASGNSSNREAGSRFGQSVVIKDGNIAVGAPYHTRSFYNHDLVKAAGAVFMYRVSDHVISYGRKVLPTDRNALDGRFGTGVDMQAGQLLVSSPNYLKSVTRYYDVLSSYGYTTYDYYAYQSYGYYNQATTTRTTQYAWQFGRINQYALGTNNVWQSSKVYNHNSGLNTTSNKVDNTNGYRSFYSGQGIPGAVYVYNVTPALSLPDANRNYPAVGETINLNNSTALLSNPGVTAAATGYPQLAGGAVRTQSVTTAATGFIVPPGSNTATRVTSQIFGKSVTTDGTRIAVGAPQAGYDNTGGTNISLAGAVYLFSLTPDKVWGLDQQIISTARSSGDLFGQKVSMNAAGLIVQSNTRTELFSRTGPVANPWVSRRVVNSYSGNDANGNRITASAVNSRTFAIGVPMRNSNLYNQVAVGDALIVRMDPKAVTPVGSVQLSSTAFAGAGSAQFAGLDGSISIAKSTEWKFAGQFTVEFFVKTTATAGTLFNYSTGANNSRVSLSINAGKLALNYRSNSSATSASSINDNQWHHIAVSFNGTQIVSYIDGVAANSAAYTVVGESPIDAPTIGGGFIGFIDDFRIYMGVSKYNAAFTTPTVALPVGVNDPLWDNLEVALNFNSDFKDAGTAWWVDETQFLYQPPGSVNGRTASDLFGSSVSLGNNLLVVGTPGYDYRSGGVYGGLSNVGTVFVFVYSNETGEWTPQGQLPEGGTITSSTRIGDFVSVKGNYVSSGTNSYGGGLARTWFQSSPGNFVYQYENQPGNFSAVPVLLNEDVLVLGLPNYSATVSPSGAFNTITRVNSTWTLNGTTVVPLHTNGRLEYNAISYTLLDGASNGRFASDNFGASVSINNQGDILAIGAPGHDYNAQGTGIGGDNGAVFTYYWDTVTKKWRFQTKVTGQTLATGVANQRWGQRVQMRDGYLVTSGNPSTSTAGSLVGFFNRVGTGVTGTFAWQSQIGTGQSSDRWGSDVTLLSNSFAVSGAPFYNSTNFSQQGSFRSMLRTDAAWAVGPYNTITGLGFGRNVSDLFGRSLALQGTTLLVGSPNTSYTATGTLVATNSGAVFVYEYNSTKNAFQYTQRLNPDPTITNSQVGLSHITFRGDTAVVNGTTNRFTMLNRTGGVWTAQPTVVGTDTQGQHNSVIDDNNVVIGVPTRTTADPSMFAYTGLSNQGAWRSYSRINGTWTLGAYMFTPSVSALGYETLAPAARTSSPQMGNKVSLSADKMWLVASASAHTVNDQSNAGGQENGNGAVFVYNWTGTKYAYHSTVYNPGLGMTQASENFGLFVDIKDDRLLITAGNATAGSYYVYRLHGDTWVMEKQNRSAMSSSVGVAQAAFLGDSTMLAVGAPTHRNYPQVVDSGRVFTSKRVGTEWVSMDQREGGWGQGITVLGLSNVNPGSGGGGGGGFVGGSGGGVPLYANYVHGDGGLGGSNLVPELGTGYAGIMDQAPLNSDPDRGSAGNGGARSASTAYANNPLIPAGAQAASGAHGRVVLSWTSGKQVFDFTGSDQFFKVPSDVTKLDIKMWGAGGGGGINLSGTGGAGGAVVASIATTPGETLTIVVGQGGNGGVAWTGNQWRFDPNDTRYGGGGRGATPNSENNGVVFSTGANGGGRSEILRDVSSLAIAGGGGGSGGQYGTRGYNALITATGSWGSARVNGQPGGAAVSGYTRRRQYNSGTSDLNVAGNIQGRFVGDQFGHSVALDGFNNVLIGVPYHQYDQFGDNPLTGRGSVFVFQRDRVRRTSTYTGRFSGSSTTTNNFYGHHMQVLGSRVLVGSGDGSITLGSLNTPTVVGGANGLGGAEVMLYDSTKRMWSTETRLSATGSAVNGVFKSALVSDSLMVRGLPRNDGTGVAGAGLITNAGAYETVTRNGASWSVQSRAVAQGLGFGRFAADYFGSTVKLGGDWVAIGAKGHRYNETGLVNRYDNNGGVAWGAVFIYKLDRNTNTWVYETKLNSTDVAFNFSTGGFSLFTIGNTLYSGSFCNSWSGGALRNWTTSWTRDSGTWSAPVAGVWNNGVTNFFPGLARPAMVPMDANTFLLGKWDTTTGLNGQPSITQAGAVYSFNPVTGVQNNGGTSFGVPLLTTPGSSNGRAASDRFGNAVFAGSNYVVVGAPNHTFTEIGNALSGSSTGALFVFNQPGGAFGTDWRLERKLNGNQANIQGYGSYITGTGNYVLVEYVNSGITAVYADQIQRVNPGTWSVSNKFSVNSGATSATSSPNAFSMGGTPDMVTVGRPYATGTEVGKPAITGGGLVNTFTRSGGVWTARAMLAAPGSANARLGGDNFGTTVALSRTNLLVGAPQHSYDADGANQVGAAGAVYVFGRVNNTYNFVNKFVAPSADRVANARYGTSVSIDDLNSYVAVGTRANLAYVYGFDGATLKQMGRFTGNAVGDNFGFAVSVNGGRLVVGAYTALGSDINGIAGSSNTGVTYMYRLDQSLTTWNLVERNYVPVPRSSNQHGYAVAVSYNGAALMGSPGGNTSGDVSIKYIP